MSLIEFLGFVALGLAVGGLYGMFGAGGFLMTPALNVILNVPVHLAVGSSQLQNLGAATSGLGYRLRQKTVDIRIALTLAGGNFAGVVSGAAVLEWAKNQGKHGETEHPFVQIFLLKLFLVMLIVIAVFVFIEARRAAPGSDDAARVGLFSRWRIPPFIEVNGSTPNTVSLPLLCYLATVVGMMSGLMGLGGGIILMPALVFLVGMDTQTASGTSLAAVWFTALTASATHAAMHNVSIPLAAALLLGSTVGAQLGAALGRQYRGPVLRQIFAGVVLVAAGLVAWKLKTLV